MTTVSDAESKQQHPLREIVQPFIDFVRAPKALQGVNLTYLFEGFVYFGMLGYLGMYFNKYVGLTDPQAGPMIGFLTWGITFSMFLFGGLADRWGARVALLLALAIMLVGRIILSADAGLGLGTGMWSATHFMALFGLLFIIFGYGMYQPAAYAAVRQLTTPKTAAMGYAMLYALMNLGGWLPSFFSPIRKAIGISGAFWVYTGITVVGLLLGLAILSRRTMERAIERAKQERDALKRATQQKDAAPGDLGEGDEADAAEGEKQQEQDAPKEPFSLGRWLRNHPLANAKFSFFIFALIPVQTLFAHNWLTLPMYVERAYRGTWLGTNFEAAVNFNPLLIFILVPIVTALTMKRKVYNMMILGTLVMSVPTFLLVLGPSPWTLGGYLIIMTVGEAMWQPRFLQYAAEIAPKGRTGSYMGVAQFPWFLTKMITSFYSGWFLQRYCPAKGELNTEFMWLVYAFIAITSTLMLILAKGWLGKDFKTKSDD